MDMDMGMEKNKLKSWLNFYLIRVQELEKAISDTKPYNRPSRDYISILSEYKLKKSALSRSQGNVGLQINQILSRRHSSLCRNLDNLMPIFLHQMRVNQIHYGSYIECTLVDDPFVTSGIQCLIEDNTGQLEFLDLYNFCEPKSPNELSDYLGKNSRLIVKEPNLIMKPGTSGFEFSIRCDSPTDIIILKSCLDL